MCAAPLAGLLLWDATHAGERAAAEKRQKLLEKKRTKEALTGVVKVKKSKSVRIRKGVRVKVGGAAPCVTGVWGQTD